MKITEYRTFDLVSLTNVIEDDGFGNKNEKWIRFANSSDIIVAHNLDSFIEQLRHIPIKKLEYLKYWDRPEHQNRSIIDSFDDIINVMLDIEKEVRLISEELGHDFFIIRIATLPNRINYLRESDLEIEFERIRKHILSRINEASLRANDQLDIKLDDLYKRTEIVFSRIGEYSHQKALNPNLKIQNKIGYSLSDV
jgi:hypothetical protein